MKAMNGQVPGEENSQASDQSKEEEGIAPLRARQISLFAAFTSGLATCIAISLAYLVVKGCQAAREAAERHERQVSDMMCCPTVYFFGAIMLPLTSLLLLAGIWPIPHVIAALDASIGTCCCCCFCRRGCLSSGKFIVYGLSAACIGNILLSIFDLCWMAWLHAIGAITFFFSGYLVIGLLLLSRTSSDKRLSLFSLQASPRLRYLKPCLLLLAISPLPVGQADPFISEWLAIASIGLAIIIIEFDIRNGEQLLLAPACLATENAVASTAALDDHQSDIFSHPEPLLYSHAASVTDDDRPTQKSSSSSSRNDDYNQPSPLERL